MTRYAFALLLIAAPALAGCLGPTSACETVTVPSGRAGLSAAYRGSGETGLGLTGAIGFVDWGGEAGAKPWPLPDGSTVRVSVRSSTRPVLNYSGGFEPAYQATYWLHPSNLSRAQPGGSEWIDADQGDLVLHTDRIAETFSDEPPYGHHRAPEGWNRSPLLGATLLWNRSLRESDMGTISADEAPLGPDIPANSRNLTWTVTQIQDSEPCMLTLSIETDFTWIERFELRFSENRPLPVTYRQIDTDGGRSVELSLEMEQYQPGSGPALPALRPGGSGPTVLHREPVRDGFLPDRGGVFPTDYDEAVAAARDKESIRQWLEDHSRARPAFVEHKPGGRNSTIEDQWMIVWRSPEGDQKAVKVQNKSRTPLGLNYTKEVSEGRWSGDARYPTSSHWVPMSEVARLSRKVYGQPPEDLDCRLGQGECVFGPVEATGEAPAGGTGGGLSMPGIRLGITSGRVFAEDSFSQAALHPPAGSS